VSHQPHLTDDGHHVVIDGRRWRATDPAIPPERRTELTHVLMAWRREVRRTKGTDAEPAARAGVHATKVALGERGAPWWTDGAPDYNRRMVANTPYAAWYAGLEG